MQQATVFGATGDAENHYDERAGLRKESELQPPDAECNLREVRLNRAASKLEEARERWLH